MLTLKINFIIISKNGFRKQWSMTMCVTLIGGMDRLEKEYVAAAADAGHSLRCITKNERNFVQKIGHPDALIVFTNKISHEAKRKAVQLGRSKKIPVQLVHSCGVSSLRDCLSKTQGN